MVKVGIVGLGMMGRTHFEAYEKLEDVQVVAVCDIDPVRAAGDLAGTGGNVLPGGITRLPMERLKGMTDYRRLLEMDEVDLVDICVPTPVHAEIAVAALEAGKHVLCEKPLARTVEEGRRIVAAAHKARGFFMPAMCMRFWPQWVWLKKAVADRTYGDVLAAVFRRVTSQPPGWYGDGAISGGALLDLHIHDTDFVCHLFGKPTSVYSRGYVRGTGQPDHVVTHYIYDDETRPALVVAEGGWSMAGGFGFQMRYTVNFEQATAEFDIGLPQPLRLVRDGRSETIDCGPEYGYIGELRYFTQCIARRTPPTVVTADDGLLALQVIEAENRSVVSGRVVKVQPG